MNIKEDKKLSIESAPRGFCLAKWFQLTLDLSRGYNHSCHHPERHLIPLVELEKTEEALHNTEFKKLQRKKMLNGVRPEECNYCWKIEDIPGNSNKSDRFIKSTDDWAYDKLDTTLKSDWNSNVAPTYLEVMFSSVCNLSCMYCMADVSTTVAKEMKQFGTYPVTNSRQHRESKVPAINDQDNPYIRAFWIYLPKIYLQLRYFRITGGEPILSPDTFLVFNFFRNNPNPNLELSLNSNLSYDSHLCNKLISHVNELQNNNSIKKFTLFASLDTFGNQAAYIRKGLSNEMFMSNLNLIVQNLPSTSIVIMCTFNILSIGSFFELINWISEQKASGIDITLDISYLKEPEYLRANIASNDLIETIKNALNLMTSNKNFTLYEIEKFDRIVNWILETQADTLKTSYRADFFKFINEYDFRYNQNFLNIFPEYKTFYKICQKSDVWMKGN